MTKVDPSLYLSNYQTERKTGSDILGKDDFLKILMTQLQNQDPMNPMEDKDFIAQMATFSSLEQMTNMNKTLEKFVNSQSGELLLKYSSMIGKEVEYSYKDTDANGDEVTKTGSGVVKSISQKSDFIQLELEDGTTIYNDEIIKVSEPSSKP
ncbi:flagellar hook assembly protein FlgD [Fredinandcohnia quinoae]|uniref:Flagellar hook assembly protein FlgD n=1 Tax=Fredinandcohnia quinoae TaxID=2918902 RepID=A0AAW5DXK6_9BACI|nr:flagellar hook assembly protein FlgD [Fredinandcohnia sp. SECRCQ15]MCH1623780.1 flagellar hook assembly protein FlgD [Fredinandcohnia sp. SECRCQ15]